MEFKYYASTNDIKGSVKFYKDIFNAVVEKSNDHHAKIKLFNKIPLLINGNGTKNRKEGYLIIKFNDNEQELYNITKQKILEKNIKFHIDDFVAGWGTTFSEFVDPFGYTWALEINTK